MSIKLDPSVCYYFVDPFLSGAFIADMVAAGKGLCHSEKTISDGRNAAMQTIVRIPQANMHLPPALVRVRADQIPTVDLPGKLSLSCDDFAIN
jgi:redox-sensitive bicupin YhaK (pirin superfamily)